MKKKSVYSEISGICGITALIIIRIVSVAFSVRVFIAFLCLAACIAFLGIYLKTDKDAVMEGGNAFKMVNNCLFISYVLIILLLLI